MKLPLTLTRRSKTERDDRAGCMVCWGAQPRWTSRNAQALAVQHHDRTGHETWYTCEIAVVYGGSAADPRQCDIEDAIAASASSGGRPDAAPLPDPDASVVSATDVSALSAANRDMPPMRRGARGSKGCRQSTTSAGARQPETVV